MDREISEMLTVPWRDLRRAAAMAVEIGRLVLPPAPRASTHEDTSGAGPYRAASVTTTYDPDADTREIIERAFRFVDEFAAGRIMDWTCPAVLDDYEGDDPVSRVYWTAAEIGDDAQQAAYGVAPERRRTKIIRPRYGSKREAEETPSPEEVARNKEVERWFAAGEIAKLAVGIVQKWASNSSASGYAPNGLLERLCAKALDKNVVPFNEVAEVIARARYVDALDGQPPDEELRLAFFAAWDVGKYTFAYSLLEPLPPGQQVE